jgi:uncharacterized protein YutE (UPF0331/DUF86 family)
VSKAVLLKKLDQMQELITELEELLSKPFDEFTSNFVYVRAAERNFQLIVDMASHVNAYILVSRGKKTPDSYKQSFSDLGKINLLYRELIHKLVNTAKLRNVLVHEYDFEEDYAKFYTSAKESIQPYKEYLRMMYKYIKENID